MPSQVPIIPDESLDAQRRLARDFFARSSKPFLSVFAGNDPVTNGIEKDVLRMAPNAISVRSHQWTKAEKLSDILIFYNGADSENMTGANKTVLILIEG